MGVEKSVGRDRAHDSNLPNFLKLTCGMPMSRASLLASASLVALVAFAAPDRALAKCSGADKTFSTATTGPVVSDGGAITVTTRGSVTGASRVTGLDGVEAAKCSVTTLGNSGAIDGGAASSFTSQNAVGVVALSNDGTIRKLSDRGTINGASATAHGSSNAVGGAGISNSGTITKLINSGTISGGPANSAGGSANPGDAIYSAGSGASIGTIVNSGSIVGAVALPK